MDATILRMVVVALGSICAICLLGITTLAAMGVEPPAALSAICTICAGALVGILVPSGKPIVLEVTDDKANPGVKR